MRAGRLPKPGLTVDSGSRVGTLLKIEPHSIAQESQRNVLGATILGKLGGIDNLRDAW